MTATSQATQNERTALSWQRTALSLMAGSVALTRFTFDHVGPASLISPTITLSMCAWVLFHNRTRYRRRNAVGPETSRHGGLAPAALVLCVVAMAVTELAELLGS
ncbi:DUF202 domain-containing protein [Segeticoccus rhizosphaerae]|uniref:DUF202 domain-containing protein n=1 Tax=Segeticoccus rhizosphaerae TaxID=1104777 RepID=UPI0010BFA4B1